MHLKKLYSLPLAFTVAFCSSLFAQETYQIESYDHMRQTPWIFLGADAGYGFLSTDTANELSKHGIHGDLKGLYSQYWKKWTLDLGAGWMVNWLKGGSDSTLLTNDRVTTLAALLEFSGRRRLAGNWELGLQSNIFLGADTTFTTTAVEEKYVSYFLGPQLIYTLPKKHPWRFSASLLTDLNIKDRQLFLLLAGVQWGIPLKPIVRAIFSRSYEDPIVIVAFDLDSIHFEFDKHKLSDHSKAILNSLGDFLAKETDSWRYLRIEGHADNRGPEEYNQKLSEKRAQAVKEAISEQGVAAERIEVIGYGESRPKTPENSEFGWAKNRRVELIFDRVKDPKGFQKAIDKIKRELGKPEIFPYTRKPSLQ